MRKILILSLFLILGLSMVSSDPQIRDASVDDIELTAGESDSATIDFVYDGDQTAGDFDPAVLNVTVEGDEGEELPAEAFDLSAEVSTQRGGVDYSYGMVCTEKKSNAFDSEWSFAEYYQTTLDSIVESESENVQDYFCFPKNHHEVLPSRSNVESQIEVTFTGNTRLAPNSFDVTYSFHQFDGDPAVDPRGQTDENGTLDFEELGLEVEAASGSNFSAVTYGSLFADNQNPSYERGLKYFRVNSMDVEEFDLEVDYDKEDLESSNLEEPDIHRCILVDGECVWSQQEANVSSDAVELEVSEGLYGLFAPLATEEIESPDDDSTSDDSGGSTNGGSTTISTDNDEAESQNQTEEQTQEGSETETEDGLEEDERPNLDMRVEMPETSQVGEEVTLQAYTNDTLQEGAQVYFNGQLQGETDEFGEYSFTPQSTGEFNVIVDYRQNTDSQQLEIVEDSGLVGSFAQSPLDISGLFSGITELFSGLF